MKDIAFSKLPQELKQRFQIKLYENELQFESSKDSNTTKALQKVANGPRINVVVDENELKRLRKKAFGLFGSNDSDPNKPYTLDSLANFAKKGRNCNDSLSPNIRPKKSRSNSKATLTNAMKRNDKSRSLPKTKKSLEKVDTNLELKRKYIRPNEFINKTHTLYTADEVENKDYYYQRVIEGFRVERPDEEIDQILMKDDAVSFNEYTDKLDSFDIAADASVKNLEMNLARMDSQLLIEDQKTDIVSFCFFLKTKLAGA